VLQDRTFASEGTETASLGGGGRISTSVGRGRAEEEKGGASSKGQKDKKGMKSARKSQGDLPNRKVVHGFQCPGRGKQMLSKGHTKTVRKEKKWNLTVKADRYQGACEP